MPLIGLFQLLKEMPKTQLNLSLDGVRFLEDQVFVALLKSLFSHPIFVFCPHFCLNAEFIFCCKSKTFWMSHGGRKKIRKIYINPCKKSSCLSEYIEFFAVTVTELRGEVLDLL